MKGKIIEVECDVMSTELNGDISNKQMGIETCLLNFNQLLCFNLRVCILGELCLNLCFLIIYFYGLLVYDICYILVLLFVEIIFKMAVLIN